MAVRTVTVMVCCVF